MSSNNNIIPKIARKIGMDGAIAYSSAARIFQAFAGVISIFFIATFLTGEEQGFYYTFGSILAIQVFFELGFTGIMTQYVAHEVVHLKENNRFEYVGEDRYKSRLAYLIRFCFKWYSVIAILFFIVVNILGVLYFRKFDTTDGTVDWLIPWTILAISTALKLIQSPFTAIFNGLGKVKEMNKIIFYQQIIMYLSQWTLFACGLKLYVVGIGSTLGVLVWCIFVFRSNLWRLIASLLKVKITDTISYFKEIFPYQWKIALSWISGYFIFQLFNPVIFATEGAVVAGQMGMTLTLLNAIQALAMNWQNTKVPYYSGLIELKKYIELDSVFNKTLKQLVIITLTLLFVMICGLETIRLSHITIGNSVLGDRFLGFIPTIFLSISVLASQFIGSWATYLRCHKKEPFLINSIVVGLLCCFSTLFIGGKLGLYGIIVGYFIIRCFISLPWSYSIFKHKRKEWHHV